MSNFENSYTTRLQRFSSDLQWYVQFGSIPTRSKVTHKQSMSYYWLHGLCPCVRDYVHVLCVHILATSTGDYEGQKVSLGYFKC